MVNNQLVSEVFEWFGWTAVLANCLRVFRKGGGVAYPGSDGIASCASTWCVMLCLKTLVKL